MMVRVSIERFTDNLIIVIPENVTVDGLKSELTDKIKAILQEAIQSALQSAREIHLESKELNPNISELPSPS